MTGAYGTERSHRQTDPVSMAPRVPLSRGPATARCRGGTSSPDRSSDRPLPYGAVMATGLASRLAAIEGLHPLVRPLFWLAATEAVVIGILGFGRTWAGRRRAAAVGETDRAPGRAVSSVSSPTRWAARATVPLGLAVLVGGLRDAAVPGRRVLAPVLLALAAAVALVVGAGFLRSLGELATSGPRRRPVATVVGAVSGAWFLLPAELAGLVVARPALGTVADRPALAWTATSLVLLALLAYCGLTVLAAAALLPPTGSEAAAGSGGRVVWWIWFGCGGLVAAAAVLARRGMPESARRLLAPVLLVGAEVTLLVGVAVAVGVVVLSLRWLWLSGWRSSGRPLWPPTFSSGVLALGLLLVGAATHRSLLSSAGRIVGLATLGVWCATVALLVRWAGRGRWRGGRGKGGSRSGYDAASASTSARPAQAAKRRE